MARRIPNEYTWLRFYNIRFLASLLLYFLAESDNHSTKRAFAFVATSDTKTVSSYYGHQQHVDNYNNNNNFQQVSSQLFASSPSSEQSKGLQDITIRECEYGELNTVAEIIMESFYDKKMAFRGMYKIAELNRLQQNFPYTDPELHQMVVASTTLAESGETVVIGFCDVDARPCKTKQILPRPYLSDLAVDPNYRRRGIAKALVEHCESFVKEIPRKELWIRVQESNEAAIAMYTKKMDYDITREEEDPQQGPVLVLHKEWGGEEEDGNDE